MLNKNFSVIIALILFLSSFQAIFAQDSDSLPIYIVQQGENLTEIAIKFNITLQELISANNIIDINLISAGTQLFIPGLEGVNGVLTTETVGFGDQLHAILKKNDLTLENFKKLNPVTSPSELYAGSTLVLPQLENLSSTKSNIVLKSIDSTLTASVRAGINPWVLGIENDSFLSNSLPGDILYFHSNDSVSTASNFSDFISKIEISPLPFSQGHTSVIYIYAKSPGQFSGKIGNREIFFFESVEDKYYYSLNGISAIAEPGLINLEIKGVFENGDSFSAEQNLLLTSGGYPSENLSVEQTTVEQEVVQTENDQIQNLLGSASPDRLWAGYFRFPIDGSLEDDSIAFSSYFGSRRSYNNGQYTGYHGGLDFRVVLMSLNIYASAPGKVIFAGPMNIRGNTLFIDHGQGIVSGYAHMKEFFVNVGDYVEQGQLIGIIGSTGRVTGPHLHWDIWVNRTTVDPFDWVNNTYP